MGGADFDGFAAVSGEAGGDDAGGYVDGPAAAFFFGVVVGDDGVGLFGLRIEEGCVDREWLFGIEFGGFGDFDAFGWRFRFAIGFRIWRTRVWRLCRVRGRRVRRSALKRARRRKRALQRHRAAVSLSATARQFSQIGDFESSSPGRGLPGEGRRRWAACRERCHPSPAAWCCGRRRRGRRNPFA